MLKLSNASFLISALLAGAAFTQTTSATVVIDQPLAREASEGVRGEGGKKGGHPAIEVKEQLARRGADDAGGDDRGGRGGRGGEGPGHPAIEVIEQLA
jgi:hypothetical protein